MAKGLRFFALFGELPSQPSGNPREYRLEFWFEGFTGTSTQIDMGGGGFTVSELSQDDEIEGVKAKKYNIQILRPFNATWEAEDFFALSEEDVEIRLFDRNTNQLLEKGYLTGDTLTDPYHDATKKINLEATCGLRRLKDRQYVTDDNKVRRGVTSLQNKLMDALRMTNLGLKVRISHHLAAVPMAVSNNSGLIVANEELHYLDLTAYDVLDRIARSANLTIFQDQGIWHIVHFYSKITTARTYDEYDEFGNFLGTGTFPISNPAIHNGPIQPRNGNIIFEPPLKKVTVTWKLGKYKNYLLNDNFENFNGTSFANWELVGDLSFDNPGGYLTRTGAGIKGNPYRLKMGGWADTFFSSAFVKQTYTIAERPDFLFEEKLTKQIIFSGSAWARDVESINVLCVLDFFLDNATKIQYYLSQSGSWTLFAGGIRDTIAISTVDPNGKSKNSEFKWEIASPRIDTLRLVTRQGQQLTLASIVRVEATVTLRQGVKRPKNPYNGVNYDSYVEYANPSMQIIDVATNLNIREIKYVAENQAKATRTHEMEAFVGDFVDPSQNACLQFISGEITKQWYSDEDQSEREFLAYTARDYLRSRAKTRKIWEGNLWGKYNMFSLFTLAGEADKFVITGFNYQYHNGYGDLRLAQLNSSQPSITIKKFATLTDGSEIEMPLDGSLTTPEVLNPYMGVQPSTSGPQEIEPNIFNLPNLTTVERGQLVFNTADNPFLGLQFADLSNPLTEPVVSKALEFKQDSVALFNNNKTVNIKMDWLGAIPEANLKVAPLSSSDEIIATREWGNTVFQPLDADLTALAGLNTVGVVRRTGAGAFATMAGTQNRVVKWGTNGDLVNTIIRETGSSVIIGADTAIDSAFEVRTSVSGVARFQNATATSQTILRIANDLNTRLAIQVFGSQYSEGSVFSVGPDGVAVSHQGNGPLAIGTFGVSQPLLLGTNSLIRARILANGRLLIGTDTDAGELLQVQGTARIATSLTTPIIGNPAGVTANNTWTFSSNVNVPLLPTASAHATSKQYVDNLVATGIKEGIPVRTIALSNITLSGTQTVSGVALIAGDRVLVAGQSTPSQNGVYIVASGSWSRATDSDTDAELRGYQYLITAGTYINAKYRNANTDAITVGTTAITYVVSQGAETDPVFLASPAAGITQQFITDWNANYAIWGTNTPDSIFATRSTTNLAEGTRLYFTDARARAAVTQGVSLNRIVAGNADGTLKDSIAYIDGGRVFTIEAEFPSLLLQGTHAEAILYRIDNFITGVSNSGFSIYDTAALSNTFVINSSRNVGIGVDNPLTRLEVGSAGATIARLRSSSGGALFIASPNSTDTLAAFGDANAIVGGGAGTRAMLWTNGIPLIIQNAQLQVNNSLITPVIGNSAGVSAQNTWTFASNINIPLTPSASTHATSKFYVDNAVQSALDAKQNLNSILTALTGISGNGVVRWNGSAFSAGNIQINQVVDLATSLNSLNILQDRTQEGPANGIRDYRSIIFKQVNRMDFGFDDVLDVPYLFYSTSQGQLINFMDAEGRWNNVDLSGNVRRYAFVDELGGNNQVPTLQQVSERGSTSNIRLRFNGIPYLIEGDIPDLQAVSQKGRNSNQRLLFNNVPYATLNDIVAGAGGSVGTISQVLAQGNNTSGLDINVNNLGIIGTRNFNGVNEMRIGDNANVRISSFNTVALNATNIVFSGQNVNSSGDNALNVFEQSWELRVAGKGINFEKNPDPNNIYSYDFVTADIAANYLVLSSPTNQFGTLDVLFPLIRLGHSETSSIAFSPKEIAIGSNNFSPVKFNFHPATFTNGQKYTFQYNSTTNTFNMVPA